MEKINLQNSPAPAVYQKYLNKYAADNKWELTVKEKRFYEIIVVIPAVMEYNNIIKLTGSLNKNSKKYLAETLFVFVVNNSASADKQTKDENLQTINLLLQLVEHRQYNGVLTLEGNINIALVDASTGNKTLPEKDAGVGLARKIGMDLALTSFYYKPGKHNILVCLDADCTVSKNYIEEIYKYFIAGNNAGYVRFEHPLPETEEEKNAILCYEIFLRYYVLGLKYAKSPYAFFTIGSTIVCSAESYIKAEGMNKRKAAEDFYFIEKLAKITDINSINSALVYPSSRGSWRVPFGTGQRVNRFLQKVQNEYLLYSPESFEILKKWLKVFLDENSFTAKEYISKAKSIHKSLHNFLVLNNFEKSWGRILNDAPKKEQLKKQKNLWFDGFRTLKLIHYLRDNGVELTPMFDAVESLTAKVGGYDLPVRGVDDIPDISTQIKYLELLRAIV